MYNHNRQVAGIRQWTQKQATPEELDGWSKEPDYGIALQTKNIRAIDVDIDDRTIAGYVRDAIENFLQKNKLPMLPVRTRNNSSKCLLPFRLAGEHGKRVIHTDHGAIEILLNGQQFIAAGTHPSGVRYEWKGGLPKGIPTLTLEQFEALSDLLVKEFASEGEQPSISAVPSAHGDDIPELINQDATTQALREGGHVISVGTGGKLNITCPFEGEHTGDSGESATTYLPVGSKSYERGYFSCLHAHCSRRQQREFYEALGLPDPELDNFDVVVPETSLGVEVPAGPRTASELLNQQFSPLRWVVPKVLPEGIFLLVASPKIGKSWLALQLVLAVATGTGVLGQEVEAGGALYLALEDNDRRLQSRLNALGAKLLLSADQGAALQFETQWPLSNEGGAEKIDGWLAVNPGAHLVVIDVLERFRPRRSAKGNHLYTEDYDALRALKTVSDKHRVAILVVHHTRKGATDDPLAMVSGTQGLAGSADGMLMLTRDRGETRGRLHVIGRDIEEDGEYVVEFKGCRWSMVGAVQAVAATIERQEILDMLKTSGGPFSSAEVAQELGKNRSTTAQLLTKMVRAGQVVKVKHKYLPAVEQNIGAASELA